MNESCQTASILLSSIRAQGSVATGKNMEATYSEDMSNRIKATCKYMGTRKCAYRQKHGGNY